MRNQTLWLDFRYERLPNYCYSCGRLGHYTDSCPSVPFEEDMIADALKTPYGPWLKAEAHQYSPYWQCYYGHSLSEAAGEETIPETPPTANYPLPLLLPPAPNTTPQNFTLITTQTMTDTVSITPSVQHNLTTALIPASEKLKGVQWPKSEPHITKGKTTRPPTKIGPAKKPRRYTPYDLPGGPQGVYDDSLLLDTPILEAFEEDLRATMAGPKQSPNQR